jgi:hypothetical protein
MLYLPGRGVINGTAHFNKGFGREIRAFSYYVSLFWRAQESHGPHYGGVCFESLETGVLLVPAWKNTIADFLARI